jgi:hypothetical protein
MLKQTIQYTSPVDALVAIAKRLNTYESQQGLTSEEFFHQYKSGQLSDDEIFIEWANDYQHYLAIRADLEKKLQHAA